MNFKGFIGQQHLISSGAPIERMINNGHFQSLIFYGNPGTGKTTLANMIADNLKIPHFKLNATNLSSAMLKEVAENTKMHDQIIIIMDEVHRLDKQKQNFLLPLLETNKVILIGTTTENPYFSVNSALRSRLLLFKFEAITKEEFVYGLYIKNLELKKDKILSQDIYTVIYFTSSGDVRMAFNILNFLLVNYETNEVTPALITQLFETNVVYDKADTHHHDLLSAFQKTIRASDVNAALHYLARLLKVGDIASLQRRLLVIAYEDIGLGNPNACMRTLTAIEAFERVGMPEGKIILSSAVIDLCLSPKSTSAHDAIGNAFADIHDQMVDTIPSYILYKQPDHDLYDREKVKTLDNLPKNLKGRKYFVSQEASRYEQALNENYKKIEKKRRK